MSQAMHKGPLVYLFIFFLLILVAGIVVAEESEPELESEFKLDPDPDLGIIPIDHIVAVVNEEVITSRELNEAIVIATNQLLKQGIEPPDIKTMETQVLESIIVKQIQLQHAEEIGLTISESELDETIRRIADENDLSLQAFYAVLEQDGVSFNNFRDDIRDEVIMVRLKEREINNRINISDSEVDNFLRNQKASATDDDEYHIAHIMIRVPEQVDVVQIEKRHQRAEAALSKLHEGVEFARVAAEFSDADDAMSGGMLDWRPASQLGPKFAELLMAMEIDELTPVIQSPVGFHILKVLGRRAQEVSVVIINQTHARHILIKVNELTSESDARHRIVQLKDRIDNGANFEQVARLHSDDGSASSGGDLGWVSPGDTVPAFEQGMNTLLPGQISEPIETPFGWHLIQVIERREQDISQERQRETARQAIRARKADMVLEEWLQQLRDQAYIDNRMEES